MSSSPSTSPSVRTTSHPPQCRASVAMELQNWNSSSLRVTTVWLPTRSPKKVCNPQDKRARSDPTLQRGRRNSAAQPVKCVEVRAVALCRNSPIRSLHLTCVTDGPISVARKIHQKTTNAIQAGRRCGARWHHQAITGNHAAGAPWTPRFGAARGSSRVALTLCPLLANFPPRLPSEPHAILQASPEDLPNTST